MRRIMLQESIGVFVVSIKPNAHAQMVVGSDVLQGELAYHGVEKAQSGIAPPNFEHKESRRMPVDLGQQLKGGPGISSINRYAWTTEPLFRVSFAGREDADP